MSQAKLGVLQLLLAKYRLTLKETGLRLNRRHVPFPKYGEPCSLRVGLLLVHLRWGEHRYTFWRQRSLTAFLRHAIKECDNFWHAQYLPAYERLRLYANGFEQRLMTQKRYIRNSQLEGVLQRYEQLDDDLELLPTLASVGFNTPVIEHKLRFYLAETSSFRKRFNTQWMQQQLATNQEPTLGARLHADIELRLCRNVRPFGVPDIVIPRFLNPNQDSLQLHSATFPCLIFART